MAARKGGDEDGSLRGLLGTAKSILSNEVLDLIEDFPELGAAIEEMSKEARKATKHIKDSAKADIVSTDEAVKMTDRLTKALSEVIDSTKKLAEANHASAKDVTRQAKEVAKVTAEMRRERSDLRRAGRQSRDPITGRFVTKEQQRQAFKDASTAKHLGRFRMAAGERGRRRFFGGKSGFGIRDDDEELGFLTKEHRGGFFGRRARFLGAGAKSGIRSGAGAMAEAGPLSGMARSGAAGLGIAAVVGGLASLLNKRREGAVASTGRAVNFGLTDRTGDTAARVSKEVTNMRDALSDVQFSAALFNQDLEAAQASMVKITAETGRAPESMGGVMKGLLRASFMQMGTIEELTDFAIKRNRETGKSLEAINEEIMGIAVDANAVAKSAGADGAVLMGEYFRSVQNLAEGLEALHVSQTGLSKAMKVSLAVTDKLGLSTERRLKAAHGLTQALSTQFDDGFATLRVMEDLQIAMKSSEFAGDAKYIADLLSSGQTDVADAARMLKETGATSDIGVMLGRLESVMQMGGAGNTRMASAMLGRNLSPDEFKLLQEFGKQQAALGPGASMADVLAKMDTGQREKLTEMIDQMAAAQIPPTSMAAATLDQVIVGLATRFEPLLSKIVYWLESLFKAVARIAHLGFGDQVGEDVKGFLKSLVMDEDDNAQAMEQARSGLGGQLNRILGADVGAGDSFEDMVQKAKTKGVLNKLMFPTEGAASEMMKKALTAKGGISAEEFEALRTEKVQRKAAVQSATNVDVNVKNEGVGADGKPRVTVTATVTGGEKAMDQAAALEDSRKASSNRHLSP